MPPKKKSQAELDHTALIPQEQFEAAFKKVLGTSKKKSDKQLAAFQASNKARRDAR